MRRTPRDRRKGRRGPPTAAHGLRRGLCRGAASTATPFKNSPTTLSCQVHKEEVERDKQPWARRGTPNMPQIRRHKISRMHSTVISTDTEFALLPTAPPFRSFPNESAMQAKNQQPNAAFTHLFPFSVARHTHVQQKGSKPLSPMGHHVRSLSTVSLRFAVSEAEATELISIRACVPASNPSPPTDQKDRNRFGANLAKAVVR